ncbi:unnamed protein product [Euphydryas editha]|uniref:Uncharacterized protein n=1 Tax=Euphydryas editha TaxID=104508 RepID=A0AAU9TAZ1_EUPED|nr:unnamed protein product [Euphydryas editha]
MLNAPTDVLRKDAHPLGCKLADRSDNCRLREAQRHYWFLCISIKPIVSLDFTKSAVVAAIGYQLEPFITVEEPIAAALLYLYLR